MGASRIFSVVLALLGGLAVLGCDKPGPVPVVSIQSAKPSGDAPLVGGELVTFTVTVRAQGLNKPGTVALVVQPDGQLLGVADAVPIEEGVPKTLEVQALIPATNSIQIFTPLYLGDAKQTSVVDVRRFKVVGTKAKNG